MTDSLTAIDIAVLKVHIDNLINRVEILEKNAYDPILREMEAICKVIDINFFDTWIARSKTAKCVEARHRTWYVLWCQNHSYSYIAAKTGFDAAGVTNAIKAYAVRLKAESL